MFARKFKELGHESIGPLGGHLSVLAPLFGYGLSLSDGILERGNISFQGTNAFDCRLGRLLPLVAQDVGVGKGVFESSDFSFKRLDAFGYCLSRLSPAFAQNVGLGKGFLERSEINLDIPTVAIRVGPLQLFQRRRVDTRCF